MTEAARVRFEFGVRHFICAAASLVVFSCGAVAEAQTASTARAADSGAAPELRAQLTPRDYTTLSSDIAGRIDRINARVGQHFKKDDVLVVFDCAIQRAQEAHARAALTQVEKTYAIDARLVQLKSMGGLELEVAGAEVAKAKADVAAAETMTSKCSISAPFSGVTADQKAREFQYATPGQPLLDVLDDSNLEVELIAPSRWLSWLKVGYKFDLRIEETDKSYPVAVTRLGGRVDPVSQSIKVFGEIVGGSSDLLAGMSGRASIAPPN
jgi:membrane fusion protein, multidrug efflux system